MYHRKVNRKSRSAIKKKNKNINPINERFIPNDNGGKLSPILESMKMQQLLLLFSGLASVGIGKRISSGIIFRAYQFLIFVSYIHILALQLGGSYYYRKDTMLLFESLVPYLLAMLTFVCPMSINWEKDLELINFLEKYSAFSRLKFEMHEKKELVLKQATKRVTMIFYVSFVGLSFCGMGWFIEPYFFKMLEKFTTNPNLNTNTTELDPLKMYTTIFWYPGIDITANPYYLIIQSFVFVNIIYVILKVTATLTFIMGVIVYISEMFKLVSTSIQDIDKLDVNGSPNQINNCFVPMTNHFQKSFRQINIKETEGLGNDSIEKFINIDEDADSQLMDGENELNAYGCLKNAIKDHQQVIK